MTEDEALKIQKEIEALCDKYGLWVKSSFESRGGKLHMIRIDEISIKVDGKPFGRAFPAR